MDLQNLPEKEYTLRYYTFGIAEIIRLSEAYQVKAKGIDKETKEKIIKRFFELQLRECLQEPKGVVMPLELFKIQMVRNEKYRPKKHSSKTDPFTYRKISTKVVDYEKVVEVELKAGGIHYGMEVLVNPDYGYYSGSVTERVAAAAERVGRENKQYKRTIEWETK